MSQWKIKNKKFSQVRTNIIALGWNWITMICWCQINPEIHCSPGMHNVQSKQNKKHFTNQWKRLENGPFWAHLWCRFFFDKSVFKILGNFNYHCPNRAQRLWHDTHDIFSCLDLWRIHDKNATFWTSHEFQMSMLEMFKNHNFSQIQHFGPASEKKPPFVNFIMHPAQPSEGRLGRVHFIFFHIQISTRLLQV